MILVQLTGGLGNQLFQYAMGRRLSLLFKTDLKFDLTAYTANSHALRAFELSNFNLEIKVADGREILLYSSPNPLLRIFAKNILSIKVVQEKSFDFDPTYESLGGKLYLQGYWQTERYFNSIESIIRSDLQFKHIPSDNNQEILKRIHSVKNSVSLHIRRGDYVQNRSIFNYHGVCSEEYYQSAVDFISEKVTDPFFFIFSDDVKWVADNFKIRSPYLIVDINSPETSYEDLRLMSTCKHNIIANSSFSWWGAWLNANLKKIVVAPKRWFANEEKNNEAKSNIPSGWIRI
jgi:hypothetical protein